jgi:hypothetical protein
VAVSRDTIHANWLPNEPTLLQLLAHGGLLHDILGFEALSSGAWYVAIDFQLYALLILLCYALQSPTNKRLSIVVALLCSASMWQFNRVDELDIWAIYFLAAYGLGVLAAWAKRSAFEAKVFVFSNQAVFKQKIKLKNQKSFTIKTSLEFMTCNDVQCLPPATLEFQVLVPEGGAKK